MKINLLRCMICEHPMVAGEKEGVLGIFCLGCGTEFPMAELIRRKAEVPYGNPKSVNAKDLLEGTGIRAVGRDGKRPKK